MLVRRVIEANVCCIEKVLHGQASGEGIKRTPAYETPLTKSELDKWRKEFWGKFQLFNCNNIISVHFMKSLM